MPSTKARAMDGDDHDVEGHGRQARDTENVTRRRESDDDTEGHGRRARGPEELKRARGPEELRRARGTEADDEADTEGHSFLPNAALARELAASRERDIQRNLQKRELKGESRRPFFRRQKDG